MVSSILLCLIRVNTVPNIIQCCGICSSQVTKIVLKSFMKSKIKKGSKDTHEKSHYLALLSFVLYSCRGPTADTNCRN